MGNKKKTMSKTVVIIPARIGSSRLFGKPLANIQGLPMIVRVLKQAEKIRGVDKIIVATDDKIIRDIVIKNGGCGVLCSEEYQSGTDRVAAIALHFGIPEDIILNVQGDLPFVDPRVCEKLIEQVKEDPYSIATPVIEEEPGGDYYNPHVVKVVISEVDGRALYFSRKGIPAGTIEQLDRLYENPPWYRHVGLYAYRNDILQNISQRLPTDNEKYERLEQIRWLEYGVRIQCVLIEDTCGIDVNTPEDLKK